MEEARRPTLGEVARFALATGLFAFGGSFAVIGRVKRVVLDENRWISAESFTEHVAVATVLPGTNATSLIVMLAYRMRGWLGALVAIVLYILPSAAMMVLAGAFYDRIRAIQAASSFFAGLAAAIVGLVASIAVDMGKLALKRPIDWGFAAGAAALLIGRWLGLLSVVVLAAIVGVLLSRRTAAPPRPPDARASSFFLPLFAVPALGLLGTVFLVFAKIGIATFGGGFAMVPALAHEVTSRGWLDERGFADAISLGQVTPGPVAITATFIGYRVAGLPGALVATVGMFGPPAVVAILAQRSLARVRSSPLVQGALAGLTPAVVGIIAAAAYHLWMATDRSLLGAVIAVATLAARIAAPRTSPLVPLFIGGAITLISSSTR